MYKNVNKCLLVNFNENIDKTKVYNFIGSVNRSVILLGLPVTECNVLLDEAVELVILKPAHQVVPVLQHQAGHALLNW